MASSKRTDVQDLIALIQRAAPDLSPDKLNRIAELMHRDMGGCRLYIARSPGYLSQARLEHALAAGVGNMSDAFAAAGVSRRHGYRLLRRRARR